MQLTISIKRLLVLLFIYLTAGLAKGYGQLGVASKTFTRNDTLRGSITPARNWWNVLRYDIEVTPDYEAQSISGITTIQFAVTTKPGDSMQIDLQQPLVIDDINLGGQAVAFTRHDHVAMIATREWQFQPGGQYTIKVRYHGVPRKAKRPPWDGGWIWSKDAKGRPWMSVACQGLGASVWYPCKDHQSDEPDRGASLTMHVPKGMVAVANGRLSSGSQGTEKDTYRWDVLFPINSYNLIPYIGYYSTFSEKLSGEKGNLDAQYWVLDYNVEKARNQFTQVAPMLSCFEYWFGPYPFYADSYKLVESPHLGMEHQSAVAYGNRYMNGYLGQDLSGSGWGTKWDFIIIHESGHEWFGNNITTNDIADMWVHEGFTNYSETLFTECQYGKQAGTDYVTGIRRNIANDRPIIGPYGVNEEGSTDMYYKGANMIHTLRTMMQDDTRFRNMLRNMNKTFFHQTVDSKTIEDFMKKESGFGDSLTVFFDQYLRHTNIPALQWKLNQGRLEATLTNALPGLMMRVYLPETTDTGSWHWIKQGKSIRTNTALSAGEVAERLDKNLYIQYEKQ